MPAPAPAEITGGTVRSSGARTRSASAARPGDDESRQEVSHTLEEASGQLHMRLAAPSVPALFIEAARAVAEVVRGVPLDASAEHSPLHAAQARSHARARPASS